MIIKIVMFRLGIVRRLFCSEKKGKGGLGVLDQSTMQVLNQRGNIRRGLRKQQDENLPAEQHISSFYDSLVKITLYMKQDCWKSQYIYLLLNYNKLGFRRISDLVFLDRASYLLSLRQKSEEERWPAVKVVVALEPKAIMSGVDQICQFFKENHYFSQELSLQVGELKSVQQFINGSILPYMESLFWHPLLTYQYSFHTNLSSYMDTQGNNIFGILRKNGLIIGSRIAKNLVSIAREGERYRSSRQKLKQGLREIAKGCFEKQQFIGGSRPNYLDFYLMAHIRTKSGSGLFMRYLEKEVGGEFWRWWIRVSSLCQYNPERITTL